MRLALGKQGIILLCTAFTTRIALLVVVLFRQGHGATLVLEDSDMYLNAGLSLATEGRIPDNQYYHMPIYPFLLSLLLRLTGSVDLRFAALAGLMHASAFALACVVTGKIGERVVQKRVGILAGYLLWLLPDSWPYSIILMPDVVYVLFLVSFTFLAVEAWQGHRIGLVYAAAFVGGLSSLVKPIGTVFAAMVTVIPPLLWLDRPVGNRIKIVTIAALLYGISPGVWMARNYLVLGVPEFSIQTGAHLYAVRHNMLVDSGLDAVAIEQREMEQIEKSQLLFERNRAFGQVAAAWIWAHPEMLAWSVLVRHWQLYAGTGTRALLAMLGVFPSEGASMERVTMWWKRYESAWPAVLQGISWMALLIVYVFGALGALFLLYKRNWLALFSCTAGIGYFAAVVLNVPHTRYRFPMDPYFSVLAAAGLEYFLGLLKPSIRMRSEPVRS